MITGAQEVGFLRLERQISLPAIRGVAVVSDPVVGSWCDDGRPQWKWKVFSLEGSPEDPKAISKEDLYGVLDPNTREGLMDSSLTYSEKFMPSAILYCINLIFAEVVGLNVSSATTPELLLKRFDHYCEYKRTPNGVVMAPSQLGKWLVLFCDEINLPDLDKYGTQ
uniref:Uncharacterized protein n=1 Tax=Amphimedon queenslandica TaxID=400682 RepID=A0A1X7SIV2_AMPQE